MAKIITYEFVAGHDGCDEIITDKVIVCDTKSAFDVNYPIAENEAVPGSINVTGEFDAEPEQQPTDSERIAQLEEALDMLLSGVTE